MDFTKICPTAFMDSIDGLHRDMSDLRPCRTDGLHQDMLYWVDGLNKDMSALDFHLECFASARDQTGWRQLIAEHT